MIVKFALAAILSAAALTTAMACGWWPGSPEPEMPDGREEAERSDDREQPTRFDTATRLATSRDTAQPTPSGRDAATWFDLATRLATSRNAAQPTPDRDDGSAPASGRGRPTPVASAASRKEYAACLD